MTHGCGTVSSGGGGGFSSGVSMTTVLMAGASQSARRRNAGNSRDDDTDCCCAVCWLVAFLLCLVKMTPKARIILTWIWVITAAVTSGVMVKQHRFADQQLADSPWDMRQLDVATSFCESVSVTASDDVDVYVLPFAPEVKPGSIRSGSPHFNTYIGANRYEYWGFYFIEGSSASVWVTSLYDPELNFYVIKGKSNLAKWIDNADCSDCTWFSSSVNIASSGYRASFEFTETDQYYFLFSNINNGYIGVDLDARFSLNRTIFDVSTGIRDCQDSESCTIELDLGSLTSVILDVPKNSASDVDVLVTCQPRVYLYVIVFGMVPAFIGICVSLGIYKYSKRGNTRTPTRSTGVANPVYTLSGSEQNVNAIVNVNYSVGPPGYREKPPSYQEAVNTA